MYLGIEQSTGLVYEGLGGPEIPSIPVPIVTHAKLIEKPEDWKSLPASSERFCWMFREDSFDPVTRTRRGRLYGKKEGTQPELFTVSRHPYDRLDAHSISVARRKTMYVYTSCVELLDKPNNGQGLTLALGSNRGASAWLVVQCEYLFNETVMVTLKALTAYGIVPELDGEKIDDRFRTSVVQAVARVVDAAFKESPGSVVDNCKDAMQVVMSSWLAQNGSKETVTGKEIAETAALLETAPVPKFCAANLGKIAGILHTRNKSNVKAAKGYRPLVQEDAEFALQSLGLTLRELGWARGT